MTRAQTVLWLTCLLLAGVSLAGAALVLGATGQEGAYWVAVLTLGGAIALLGASLTVHQARQLQHHEDHCEQAWPDYRRRTPRRALMPAQRDRDLDDLEAMLDATREDNP